MRDHRNTYLTQFVKCALVGWIADLLPAGGRRVDTKEVGETLLANEVGEDGLGHGGSADVAVANEEYFYHQFFISFYLGFSLIYLGFMRVCGFLAFSRISA